MEQKADSHLTSDDGWPRILWNEIVKSVDFAGALVVFAVTVPVALDNTSIRESAQGTIIAVGGAGIALAGVVGAILAIIAVWFDEAYRMILQRAQSGWRGAMRPYKITATLGLTTALAATLSLVIWSIANAQLQAVLLALTLSLFVWTLIGTIQIVWLTFFHGQMRSELLRGIDEARRALVRRRKEKQVS